MKSLFFLFLVHALLGVPVFAKTPYFVEMLPSGWESLPRKQSKIDKICKPLKGRSDEEYIQCESNNLKPAQLSVAVYEAPSLSAGRLGSIKITVTSGSGVSAKFVSKDNKNIELTPDSAQDWGGNEAQFVFTVKSIKGDWLELPRRPFSSSVWINLVKDFGEPGKLIPLQQYHLMHSPWGPIQILKIEDDKFVYIEDKMDGDRCGDGESVIERLKKSKRHERKIRDLYDSDGHLQVWTIDSRGC